MNCCRVRRRRTAARYDAVVDAHHLCRAAPNEHLARMITVAHQGVQHFVAYEGTVQLCIAGEDYAVGPVVPSPRDWVSICQGNLGGARHHIEADVAHGARQAGARLRERPPPLVYRRRVESHSATGERRREAVAAADGEEEERECRMTSAHEGWGGYLTLSDHLQAALHAARAE